MMVTFVMPYFIVGKHPLNYIKAHWTLYKGPVASARTTDHMAVQGKIGVGEFFFLKLDSVPLYVSPKSNVTVKGKIIPTLCIRSRYFRMSPNRFQHLLGLVTPLISKKDTSMRKAIPAEERLALTLRFLATGDFPNSL
jgi:hypothetical protein